MAMWKRIAALALCAALLLGGAALARPDDELFETGKKALGLLSYGEYDNAIKALGLPDITADDLKAQMEKDFSLLFQGTVQTKVAVMFREDRDWYLAIPVADPADDRVETIVYALGDGSGFVSISASRWGDVAARLDESPEFVWNEEYLPSAPVLMSDL